MGYWRKGLLVSAAVVGGIGTWSYMTFGMIGDGDVAPIGVSQANFYRSFPLRLLSRGLGAMLGIPLPSTLREPVYSSYCKKFGCNVNEAEKPAKEYRSLASFFSRSLKEDARPISQDGALVSPCDGKIISLGRVSANGSIDQIKGMSYQLRDLLCAPNDDPVAIGAVNVGEGVAGRVQAADSGLFYMTIYLGPGDYHGFHAPTDWQVRRVRHVAGELLSVRPNVMRRVPDILTRNERVAILGRWPYGFLSLVAVGATNVGSIEVDFADKVRTNLYADSFGKVKSHFIGVPGEELKRGAKAGTFRLGSSIVLIFEAPGNFRFCVKERDTLVTGVPVGNFVDTN